jgi:hypothetical protein
MALFFAGFGGERREKCFFRRKIKASVSVNEKKQKIAGWLQNAVHNVHMYIIG